ncbi:hypothetical protein KY347_01895 [Candidatus Woesearchaeota archaeon]|nr:hypothetical protein [Candidatus Woesearchaeota archaeon]
MIKVYLEMPKETECTCLEDLLATNEPIEVQVAKVVKLVYDLEKMPNTDEYREACNFLVDHRDKLVEEVEIYLPPGLLGIPSAWENIIANSKRVCSCNKKRVILPEITDESKKFIPNYSGEVIISPNDEIYFKHVNGSKRSTYAKVHIVTAEEGYTLEIIAEPFKGEKLGFYTHDGGSYSLKKLAEELVQSPNPAMLITPNKIPIFAITGVDPNAGSVTIVPAITVIAVEYPLQVYKS